MTTHASRAAAAITTAAFTSALTATLAAALAATIITAASPAPAKAQRTTTAKAASAPLATLDAYVERAMRDWQLPGLAIAVVRNDSVVLARGYGVREIGKPERVDANTVFAIASTTKAFTSAAMGMLVDAGTLDWDDPVAHWLP
jgi:CubicO group peptidase (beta-lactamase class C family)